MKIAIVSDEISLDFEEATEYGCNWGITNYELRCLKTGRVPYILEDEVRVIQHCMNTRNVKIAALSPGLFKISLKEEETLKYQMETTIYDSFRLAEKLGTRKIIIFGFQRYPDELKSNYSQIIYVLRRMAALAEKYRFLLLMENEPGYWCDTGTNTAKILKAVKSPWLRANWDPANACAAGELAFPRGYRAIQKYLGNLHIKDCKINPAGESVWVTVGEGDVDWKRQLAAVVKDTKLEYLTIETHCQPLIEKSKLNVWRVRGLLEKIKAKTLRQ